MPNSDSQLLAAVQTRIGERKTISRRELTKLLTTLAEQAGTAPILARVRGLASLMTFETAALPNAAQADGGGDEQDGPDTDAGESK